MHNIKLYTFFIFITILFACSEIKTTKVDDNLGIQRDTIGRIAYKPQSIDTSYLIQIKTPVFLQRLYYNVNFREFIF